MAEDVQLSVQGEVAFLQLSRPRVGNGLRAETFEQLRRLALRLSDAPPAYVVITGEGPDFCVGLDLGATGIGGTLGPLVESRDAYRVQEQITRMRGVLDSISRIPCPIIAAVEGRCHGAGFELGLAADLRVASDDATFALSGVQDGVFSGLGGLTHLSVALGTTLAQSMALTGAPWTAAEAHQHGLVSSVYPSGSARAAALDLVAQMKQGSPAARLQTLLALRAIRQKLTDGMREQEIQCAARTWIAGDWQRSR